MPTTIAPKPRRRKRRFQRSGQDVAFRLTDRDIEIIRLVARHRFLSSKQILVLLGGSEQNLLRRLYLLWQAGYLDRPKAQLNYYLPDSHNPPIVYALADLGARTLNRLEAAHLIEDGWAQKNHSIGKPFIAHTLKIADLHVALTSAARRRPDVSLFDDRALIARFPTVPADLDRAFQWSTRVTRDGLAHPIAVKPDYAFALSSPEISLRAYIAECDRSTMPITRADFRQTSITRKYAAYIQGLNDKLHVQQFGWKAMRILFLTSTQARADNMRAALTDYTTVPALRRQFYFATFDAIADNALADVWIDGNGEMQALI